MEPESPVANSGPDALPTRMSYAQPTVPVSVLTPTSEPETGDAAKLATRHVAFIGWSFAVAIAMVEFAAKSPAGCK